MSFNYNKVFLAGNLTRDPQVRFLANDKAVADFGLAANRKWKNSAGELQEETTFVDVEAWGKTAELVGQYLTKGRGCFVDGRLKLETWEDKETGQKRSKLKIIADAVQFTDSAPADKPATAEKAAAKASAPDRSTAVSQRELPSGPTASTPDGEPPF